DVVMPLMNGKDLEARVAKARPGIKTLFMSGYTADTIAPYGVLDEEVNFIHKPFTVASLAEKVRRVLDAG
ncbi:MAG: hybrid sensor histidine kinase/response regulator, partial [Deltaproteobacteria bacterium]|nr:hybrid sensor histidine kinase/response regulator [Deltaproteobacteria bacterium]